MNERYVSTDTGFAIIMAIVLVVVIVFTIVQLRKQVKKTENSEKRKRAGKISKNKKLPGSDGPA